MHGHTVDVLRWRDGFERCSLVDLAWDGMLEQDSVDPRVLGQRGDHVDQFVC